ncbi:MAG: hypothetical protein EOO01_09775 [Chitinophagaceae bacterium]|nr:MAG: hypothetical protein EOO01_09775 [Chitinophagaceae bacterium]
MKKYIAIILFLLVAAGSFYPCCLDDDCAGELAQTENHSPERKQGDDQGFCSPFSACASCAASVDITTGVLILHQSSVAAPRFSEYLVANIEEVYSSLFQPPRACRS